MFKGGCGMASTGTLCISIIILIIVIILIVMVCYNYNQTQNTQTTQPYIQQPGLAAAAAYKYKNNFVQCGDDNMENGSIQCCGKKNGHSCTHNQCTGVCSFGYCHCIY